MPAWFGTYTWDEQLKRNGDRDRERDAKLRAASVFTPEEQNEMDDWTRQARDKERQAVAVIRTNPDEASRLRAEARPFREKANTVREAHNQRIAPQLEAIRQEYAAGYVNSTVTASLGVSDVNKQPEAREPRQEFRLRDEAHRLAAARRRPCSN